MAGYRSNGHHGAHGDLSPEEIVRQQIAQLREQPHELVERLASYVGFELSRRTAMGQLDPGDVLRDEVVDNAFASALTRLEEGVPIRDLHTYLRSRAQDMIRREIRRVGFERQRFLSLDQVIYSEDADPGEQVTLADVIPDNESRDLESASIDAEVLTYLIDSLSNLPDRWRSVFLERTIQGKSAQRIADEEAMDIDEVRRIVILSRDFLRDRMENVYQILDPDDF